MKQNEIHANIRFLTRYCSKDREWKKNKFILLDLREFWPFIRISFILSNPLCPVDYTHVTGYSHHVCGRCIVLGGQTSLLRRDEHGTRWSQTMGSSSCWLAVRRLHPWFIDRRGSHECAHCHGDGCCTPRRETHHVSFTWALPSR